MKNYKIYHLRNFPTNGELLVLRKKGANKNNPAA